MSISLKCPSICFFVLQNQVKRIKLAAVRLSENATLTICTIFMSNEAASTALKL